MPKVYYEPQISIKGGTWWLTVRISVPEGQWTSSPLMLDVASMDEAREEAARQVNPLRAALEGAS